MGGIAVEFSLSFFSAVGDGTEPDKYRLLLDASRFADDAGFGGVWIPERHFHRFGGPYPNPAVAAAAVAAVTSRITIRAGSVVLPLAHPVRVAEEWSVVDNLSGGRVEVSFASGWQRNDFVLAPQNYAVRKTMLADAMDAVRRLWRGEAVGFPLDDGSLHEVRTFPRPVQAELPVWLTSAGTPATAELAGRLGAGLLTHLAGQSYDDLAALVRVYRDAHRAATGQPGRVALMLHTLLGADSAATVEAATPALKAYLRSAAALRTQARGQGIPEELLSEADWDAMLSRAARRYLDTGALIGDLSIGVDAVAKASAAGVDEISCLIDFIDSPGAVMDSLALLDQLRHKV
jgi:natural product biosynthesis luciferase-like monooxygenase protein